MLPHFAPHSLAVSASASGCLTCEYFQGPWSGGHVVCELLERETVIGDARMDCAYWMRAGGRVRWLVQTQAVYLFRKLGWTPLRLAPFFGKQTVLRSCEQAFEFFNLGNKAVEGARIHGGVTRGVT